MDTKQSKVLAPKLVKVKVRENNKYGSYVAGDVFDIDETELKKVPHCLISVEEEKKQQAAMKAAVNEKTEQARAEFASYRKMFDSQLEAAREREKLLAAQKVAEAQAYIKHLNKE